MKRMQPAYGAIKTERVQSMGGWFFLMVCAAWFCPWCGRTSARRSEAQIRKIDLDALGVEATHRATEYLHAQGPSCNCMLVRCSIGSAVQRKTGSMFRRAMHFGQGQADQ